MSANYSDLYTIWQLIDDNNFTNTEKLSIMKAKLFESVGELNKELVVTHKDIRHLNVIHELSAHLLALQARGDSI
jgi:hypothetical protein